MTFVHNNQEEKISNFETDRAQLSKHKWTGPLTQMKDTP